MSNTVRYSLLRILIFLATLGVLWLAGLKDPLLLLLVAATVSMLISVFALSGMRDRMSAEIVERRRQHDSDKAARARGTLTDEDVEDDAFR